MAYAHRQKWISRFSGWSAHMERARHGKGTFRGLMNIEMVIVPRHDEHDIRRPGEQAVAAEAHQNFYRSVESSGLRQACCSRERIRLDFYHLSVDKWMAITVQISAEMFFSSPLHGFRVVVDKHIMLSTMD